MGKEVVEFDVGFVVIFIRLGFTTSILSFAYPLLLLGLCPLVLSTAVSICPGCSLCSISFRVPLFCVSVALGVRSAAIDVPGFSLEEPAFTLVVFACADGWLDAVRPLVADPRTPMEGVLPPHKPSKTVCVSQLTVVQDHHHSEAYKDQSRRPEHCSCLTAGRHC